jgi:hypothetical protein
MFTKIVKSQIEVNALPTCKLIDYDQQLNTCCEAY